ncbi:hypothetical protein C8Q80DRAFT_516914 [Daedaleopsis nitida]|nr:hypothetical protein C8Q80DRAFT_516914 [Daedaleopsis nitida]
MGCTLELYSRFLHSPISPSSDLAMSTNDGSESKSAPNPPLSTPDTPMTVTSDPQVTAAAEAIETIKGSLGTLGKVIGIMGEETVKMIQVGGEAEIACQIESIRCAMVDNGKKQEEQISELQDLLHEVLEKDVMEHMTKLIQAGLLEEIDALVAEHVELLLPEYIPQNIQEELRGYKSQLQGLERALHNSESRRANATLEKLHEGVATLLTDQDKVSQNFPRTLGEMISVSAETAASLMKEYGLGEPAPSRERNINRFLQHCGITYQLKV